MTLNHIFAISKETEQKEQKSDAIYSIPCNNCNQEYIGHTKRQFGTRLKEHQKTVPFQKRIILLCRSTRAKQIIAWNNSKIITWHINSTHAPLNRDDGGLLPDAYLHLINR